MDLCVEPGKPAYRPFILKALCSSHIEDRVVDHQMVNIFLAGLAGAAGAGVARFLSEPSLLPAPPAPGVSNAPKLPCSPPCRQSNLVICLLPGNLCSYCVQCQQKILWPPHLCVTLGLESR